MKNGEPVMTKTIKKITKLLPHLDSASLRDLLRMTRETARDGRTMYLTELRSRNYTGPTKSASDTASARRRVVA